MHIILSIYHKGIRKMTLRNSESLALYVAFMNPMAWEHPATMFRIAVKVIDSIILLVCVRYILFKRIGYLLQCNKQKVNSLPTNKRANWTNPCCSTWNEKLTIGRSTFVPTDKTSGSLTATCSTWIQWSQTNRYRGGVGLPVLFVQLLAMFSNIQSRETSSAPPLSPPRPPPYHRLGS